MVGVDGSNPPFPIVSSSSLVMSSSDKEGMIRKINGLLFFSLLTIFSLNAEEYLIQKGDTVAVLAQKKKLPVDLIQKANPDRDVDALKAGDRVWLPERYVVKAGDTLYSLSRLWGVDQSAVQVWNGLTGPLRTGQTLFIPVAAKVKVPAMFWPVEMQPHAEDDRLKSVTFATTGDSFRSVSDGAVVFLGEFRGVGRVLLVQAADKTVFAYGNFQTASVQFGQSVSRGQVLGVTSSRSAQRLSFFAFRQNEPLDLFGLKR